MSNARAAIAKRRVKRAQGLLSEAVRDMAALADGADLLGTFDLPADLEQARAALDIATAERGGLHVHIVAVPATPTTAPRGGRGDTP